MVSTTVLTGGALYLGYKACTALVDVPRSVWWQGVTTRLHKLRMRLSGQSTSATPSVAVDSLTPTPPSGTSLIALLGLSQGSSQTVQQQLLVAVTSLGVATTTTLYAPALRIVCVPVLLYLGAAPAHSAYQALRQEKRVTVSLAETVVLALCLVQGYYVVGSLGFVLYYLGQVVSKNEQEQIQERADWQPPAWAWRRGATETDGTLPEQVPVEVITPVSALAVGDTVVVHTSEMVPVSGVVTTGVAWVRPKKGASLLMRDEVQVGVKVSPGHTVEAADIVLVGCICVTVMTTHPA